MDRLIAKTELMRWLRSLVDRYIVIGPVVQPEGPAVYRVIEPDSEISLHNDSWTMSPREVLLPREELLFSVRGRGEECQIIEPEADGRPILLAGLRLCDAKAVQVLDNVYLKGRFRDPYYAAKREGSVLVGVVCSEPRWSCFCTSLGEPIGWMESLDITLTDIGESFYMSGNSEAGNGILEATDLPKPTDEDERKKEAAWQRLAKSPAEPFAADLPMVPEKNSELAVKLEWDHPVWAEVANRCLACGICNYLCPSCSCFDIQDEIVRLDCVERFRCRDTCQFSDFTRMGAGHNPRADQLPRSRQRIMHKFRYQPEQIGMYGCTGCGRCIEACPVNIDVRRILARMLGQMTEAAK